MSLVDLEPYGLEWMREQDERMHGAPVQTMADEHSAWHAYNGPFGCPWDACDPYDDETDWAARDAEATAAYEALGEELPGDPWNMDADAPF